MFLRVVDRILILTVDGFLEGVLKGSRAHSGRRSTVQLAGRGLLGLFLEVLVEKTT